MRDETSTNAQKPGAATPLEPSLAVLERNLRLMQLRSALAANLVAQTLPLEHVSLQRAADGCVTGTMGQGANARQLASLRGPALEAKRLVDTVDLKRSALVAVRGFAAGSHIEALSERMGRNGVIIVFEPDAALLRAVLERVDFSPLFARCNVVIVTTADDTGAMSDALHGLEGLVAAGVTIVDHPPSKSRLGEAGEKFAKTLLTVIQAARTNVVTALVQVEQTMMNYMGNVHAYATWPGIADLESVAKGRAAVVVAAGPSLRKNVEQLRDPHVRERVVVIAVQTVLKQLLAMGIKPDFVCALDYHEISTRFYEGLTASDVEGVTLVVEPKASPAILQAFPGEIRCVGDDVLDRIIGPELTKPAGELPPGATVAHLCYYLARYLGCDPVLLIGQDLGFTDHQYYSPGAAIHQVWAAELGEFRTLETMEFERIMRMRGWLRKLTGVDDRPIFTDEQMHTYLLQFERDFMRDAQRGLVTIDATEGGVRKQHTTIMPLREALATHATGDPIKLPRASKSTLVTRERLEARFSKLREECATLKDLCERTMDDLKAMREVLGNANRVNAIVERIQPRGAMVQKIDAHWLVQRLSQNGQLKRFKADREIALSAHGDQWDEHRLRIERDFINMEILHAGAVRMSELLGDAIARGRGETTGSRTGMRVSVLDETPPMRSVAAMLWVDCDLGSLLTPRNLADTVAGTSILSDTLQRLEACDQVDRIILLTPHARRVAELLRTHRLLKPTEIVETSAPRVRERLAGVKAARIFQRHSWRGGINGLTIFDELFEPSTLLSTMQERDIDAAVLVGADWVALQPTLMDEVIERYRCDPVQNRLTFSQAAAGLCGCVVDRSIVADLATARGPWATIGAILGYHPHSPKNDPIAKDPCVKVPVAMRDLLLRCSWDDVNFRAIWSTCASAASGAECAQQLDAAMKQLAQADQLIPESLDIELDDLPDAQIPVIVQHVRRLLQRQPALAVTLRAATDRGPWRNIADVIRTLGAAVHLRLSYQALTDGARPLTDALDLRLDAISLDLPGDSQTTWDREQITPSRESAWDAVQTFLDERAQRVVSVPHTWLVPRLMKRDAVLDDIDSFFDRWLLTAGACVIDAPTVPDRLEPLPVPASVRVRDVWSRSTLSTTHDVHHAAASQRPALPGMKPAATAELERAI
jgi:hypothetical protein